MTFTRITLSGNEVEEHWLPRDMFKRYLIKDAASWVMSSNVEIHYVPIWLMPATLLLRGAN